MGDKAASSAITHIIESQEKEIKRVAYELHEEIGQNLYSLYTGLQFIEIGIEQTEMKNYVHKMSKLMEQTIQQLRLLTVEIHPPTLSTLGLFPALKSYTKLFTSTFGILADIKLIGIQYHLTEQKGVAIFRVFQEALMNIAKYADTSKIQIDFYSSEEFIRIEINDFGKGFDMNDSFIDMYSSGISAMKERMRLIGGKCQIHSKVGKGTTVTVFLPLKEIDEGEIN